MEEKDCKFVYDAVHVITDLVPLEPPGPDAPEEHQWKRLAPRRPKQPGEDKPLEPRKEE